MPLRMPILPDSHRVAIVPARRRRGGVIRFTILLTACVTAVASMPQTASTQTVTGVLTSRAELSAAATQAEQSRNPLQAAAIRQRLRDGDFQVGDRILLTVFSDAAHSDTLVVRDGRVIDLPGKAVLSLSGVLRSELKDRVTTEVLKYVKAQQVDVTPLTRIGVLGEVARPGYFAFRSDVPITDAIMQAGGPTATADLDRSVVRRGSREYRSADETRRAVAKGLTLDQLGLSAGDELVVGRQRQFFNPATSAALGMIASLAAIFFTVHH
jgi:protein involved in polysaccharide export with SLBB domain